jgi:hypothetical protein
MASGQQDPGGRPAGRLEGLKTADGPVRVLHIGDDPPFFEVSKQLLESKHGPPGRAGDGPEAALDASRRSTASSPTTRCPR